jgi:excinuclease ABC subunit B
MRLSTLNSLLTYKDTIVVASVASIYGSLNPEEYKTSILLFQVGDKVERKSFINTLVKINYARNNIEIKPGTFQVKGDIIKIAPSWTDKYYLRIDLFGDEIESIAEIDVLTGEVLNKLSVVRIFPADAYTTKEETLKKAIERIKADLEIRLKQFTKENKLLEKQRLEERVRQDVEAMEEFGFCSGIENYSLYMDNRAGNEKPYTIFDYLPKDGLLVIDESHMMIPQLNAMYNGDRARKSNLVEYGFRLPSALDNRPLKFSEFENIDLPTIFVSATPSAYEVDKSNGVVVSQIIRPTGLLDPIITIETKENQIEKIFDHLQDQIKCNERALILTTTIRMSEELTNYLKTRKIKAAYLHSGLKTFERAEVLRKLRKGIFDVVVGINLLREGIDLPEVSLILVLDADFESFFRSKTSLVQIVGRAARNVNGRVVFYADKTTKSMEETMKMTMDRRKMQHKYNQKNGITPKTIVKDIVGPLNNKDMNNVIDLIQKHKNKDKKSKALLIDDLRNQMLKAAKDTDFERAVEIRDIILELNS